MAIAHSCCNELVVISIKVTHHVDCEMYFSPPNTHTHIHELISLPQYVNPMSTDTIRSWEVEYRLGSTGTTQTQAVSEPSTTALTLTTEKGAEYNIHVAGVNV